MTAIGGADNGMGAGANGSGQAVPVPTFAEALRVWARIGVLSFGGPAGQIALMHREVVEQRGWLDEEEYLNALNFCMLLPGPEAMQLATYAGWRLHGVAGGLAAGLLFVLPGAMLVLALAMAYAAFGQVPAVEALFLGVKAAVLVIVVEALLRISRRALVLPAHWLIAAAAFIAIFFFTLPYPLIVIAAGSAGFLLAIRNGDQPQQRQHGDDAPIATMATIRTVLLWAAIWWLPLLAIGAIFGSGHVLTDIGIFFSKLAVVTFGGAYAVLAYMGQEAVNGYGWLQPGEMLDGLGLAETTLGPLILVTEFVGYLAAHRLGSAAGPSVAMGVLGAGVTLWATFAPCFLWVFAGAPYVTRLSQMPRMRGALQGVTAAVVGVILNLTLWFALHVLFSKISEWRLGPVRLWQADASAFQPEVAVLAMLAGVMLLYLHQGIMRTLAACAALGLAFRFLF